MTDKDTNSENLPVEEPSGEETVRPEEETQGDTVQESPETDALQASAPDEAVVSEEVTEEPSTEEEPVHDEVVISESSDEDVSEDGKVINPHVKVALIMQSALKTDTPEFRSGDTVKVHVKIIEGNKERIQVFEGVVIGIKHGGVDQTFTVRKTSWGVGVERTFFINSPRIAKIEVTRRGKVRRAKLYYLRERAGKSARIKERRMNVPKSTKTTV